MKSLAARNPFDSELTFTSPISDVVQSRFSQEHIISKLKSDLEQVMKAISSTNLFSNWCQSKFSPFLFTECNYL